MRRVHEGKACSGHEAKLPNVTRALIGGQTIVQDLPLFHTKFQK